MCELLHTQKDCYRIVTNKVKKSHSAGDQPITVIEIKTLRVVVIESNYPAGPLKQIVNSRTLRKAIATFVASELLAQLAAIDATGVSA